jgi:agmatinase
MTGLVFGDIPREFSTYSRARTVILPVPYEETTSYLKGTALGPEAILKASYQIELFDEKLTRENFTIGIHTLPFMDVALPAQSFFSRLEDQVSVHVDNGKIPVLFGGEHTITLGAVKALKKRYPRIGVVHIDAHADLRDSYEDNPYSHACVMRRVLEHAPVHQIGIRSLSLEEFRLIESEKLNTVFCHQMCPKSIEAFLGRLPDDIYLTVDMDGFDPAVVPGVGTPEPGGLTWLMADNLLDLISSRSKIRAFDVVELRPIPDEVRSEVTAARLVYRLLGYIGRDQRIVA